MPDASLARSKPSGAGGRLTAGCSAYYVGGVSVKGMSFNWVDIPNSAIRIPHWKALCVSGEKPCQRLHLLKI
jgi:hypothetical protein